MSKIKSVFIVTYSRYVVSKSVFSNRKKLSKAQSELYEDGQDIIMTSEVIVHDWSGGSLEKVYIRGSARRGYEVFEKKVAKTTEYIVDKVFN